MVSVIRELIPASRDEIKRVVVMSWLERYDFPEKGISEVVLVIPADQIVMGFNDVVKKLKKDADGYDPGGLVTSKTCMRFFVEQFNPSKIKFDPWMDLESGPAIAKARAMVVDRLTLSTGKKALNDLGLAASHALSTIFKKDVMLIQVDDPAFYEKYEYLPSKDVAPYKLGLRGADIGAFLINQNEMTARSYSDGVARCRGKTLNIATGFSVCLKKCYTRSLDQKVGGTYCGIEVEYLHNGTVLNKQVFWGDEKISVDAMLQSLREEVNELKKSIGMQINIKGHP